MPEINGKQVIFKDTLAAAEWWPLMPALAAMEGKDGQAVMDALNWSTVCAMIAAAVKSWEFGGEPSNPEAVGGLDVFSELMPLIVAISQLVGQKASRLGESASAST